MKKSIHTLLHFQLLGLLLALMALCASPYYWFADLFTHFALQYMAVAFIACIGFLFLRAGVWKALISAFCFLVFGALVASLFLMKPLVKNALYEDITILQFNINYANADVEGIAGWINNYGTISTSIEALTAQAKPDIVVLQEVSPEVVAKLTTLKKSYPHSFLAPKEGAFGMAIFSRIPLSGKRVKFTGSWNEYAELRFTMPRPALSFTLTELHTMPPVGEAAWQQRNNELKEITIVVNRQPESGRIMIGDLNITPYSPWFWEMERSTRLRNSMQGGRITGTWPSLLPSILRIPIDHMLVSDNIEVLERRVEADQGSDHLPVVTKLRIYANN